MTNIYERALMVIGGVFTLFCLVSVLLGEMTALWMSRAVLVCIMIAGGAYGVTWTKARIQNVSREHELTLKREQAELKKVEAEATRAARESEVAVHRLHGPGMMVAVDHTGGTPQISSYGYHPEPDHSRGIPLDAHPEPLAEAQPGITALDIARNVERAFIIGGTRSGKTYFCKQLAYNRLKKGDMVFALDPKDIDPDDLWPEGVVVIGTGDDYDAMEDFWDWLDAEKAERGADMRAVKYKPFILIFFDEINDTLEDRPEFRSRYVKVLRKYAQYRIGIFCIGHTDNVEDIGLKGRGQLKSNFDVNLYFQFNEFVGRRISQADMKDGAGKRELAPYQPVNFITGGAYGQPDIGGHTPASRHGVTPSNPYVTGHDRRYDTRDRRDNHDTVTGITYHPGQPEYVWEPPKPQRIYEAADHKKMCEMHEAGASLSAIARAIWGAPNGRRTKQIKEILTQYGIKK